MTERLFVDTNVLLYHWDGTEPAKQRRASEWLSALWGGRNGRLSIQVLTEFYVIATQKLRPALEPETAQRYVRTLFEWEPVTLTEPVLEAAWHVQGRYQLSWWDALIVAAAQRTGCRTLLSEDFQEGQQFEQLTVANPFHASPPSGVDFAG